MCMALKREVVPCVWLSRDERKCRWPSYKDSKNVRKAIMEAEQVTPMDSWEPIQYEYLAIMVFYTMNSTYQMPI